MKAKYLEYSAFIRIGSKKRVDQFQAEGWCVEDFYSLTIDPIMNELKDIMEIKHLFNPFIMLQNTGIKSLIYYNAKGESAKA